MTRRIASIDFFRSLSIFAVICIHTGPFWSNEFNCNYLKFIINQGARFGVPFFFIASGYFFGKKLQSGFILKDLFVKIFKRLLLIFAFWSTIYLIVPSNINQLLQYGLLRVTYWKIHWLLTHPITLLLEGSQYHLWFLISLLSAYMLITFFIHNGLDINYKLLYFASALYIFALLSAPYSSTQLGISIPFNSRNGPFISTLYVAIGYYISFDRFQVKPLTAIGLMAIGYLLHMIEAYILWRHFNVSLPHLHSLCGTVIWSTGIMLFCLSNENFAKSSYLSSIGKYTLGIYVSHFLFVNLLQPLGKIFNCFYWEIGFPFIVGIASLTLTLFITRYSRLRGLVS